MALKRSSSMKTQLVDAIQLQEVELEEEINTSSSNNTPAEAAEAKGEEHTNKTTNTKHLCLYYSTCEQSSSIQSSQLIFDLCSPNRTKMLHRGGGCGEHRLWTLPYIAFCHHG